MELETFDDLTRAFSGTSTRRRFGGLLTALGLGTVAGLGLLGAADTEAKKRHKRRHKRHKNRGKGGGNNGGGGGTGTTDPTCVPDCVGPLGPKFCGSDGCGGTCGECPLFKPICNQITFTCDPVI